jgi:serine/threonine protein kinase
MCVVTARKAAAGKRQEGELVAGKYQLERQLGAGGMGVVYAARHLGTGRRVAIKCMSSDGTNLTANARFMREAQAAGRIDHPNVVQVFDVGEDARGRFIVMEFLQGESLADVLHQRRLAPADAIDLLMPALRGVHAAHRQGVVHRDLKPDNIFVSRGEDGSHLQVKVLDFGISKLTADAAVEEDLTRTGVMIGTPEYMPPERINGLGDADKRSDVYALGVILYEALTGRRPFDHDRVPKLLEKISAQPARSTREFDASIPPELDAIVFKAMARRIADRYDDVETFARALEPFAGEERFQVLKRDPTGRSSLDNLTVEADRAGRSPAKTATRIRRVARVRPGRLWLHVTLVAGAVLALLMFSSVGGPSARRLEGRITAGENTRTHTRSKEPAPPRPHPPAPVRARAVPLETGTVTVGGDNTPGAKPPTSVTEAPIASAEQQGQRAAGSRTSIAPLPNRSKRGQPRVQGPAAREHGSAVSAPRAPKVARGVRTGGMSEQDF